MIGMMFTLTLLLFGNLDLLIFTFKVFLYHPVFQRTVKIDAVFFYADKNNILYMMA